MRRRPSTPSFEGVTHRCATLGAGDVSSSTQRRLPMRAPALFALHLAFPAALLAQGWIIPRPPTPICRDVCIAPPVAALERTSSNVRATLADHVLRYEVEETFRNRGATVQEADYMYPLPAGAAFQELQLSINGQLVSGEIMDAGRARSTYEEIVRRQRDPALVEWM